MGQSGLKKALGPISVVCALGNLEKNGSGGSSRVQFFMWCSPWWWRGHCNRRKSPGPVRRFQQRAAASAGLPLRARPSVTSLWPCVPPRRMVSFKSFSANPRLPKLTFTRIIVKESMCYPCLRTPVTYVSGLYTRRREGWVRGDCVAPEACHWSFSHPL